MEKPQITSGTLEFLKELKTHNNREWFEDHRDAYQLARNNIMSFTGALNDALDVHDQIERRKLFRIHRDLRFSRDKTPYKPHFAISFSRKGAHRRGGYYLRIRPGESFIACGFWAPEKEDLLRIRKELQQDATEFRAVIEAPSFKNSWGELQGDAVKTAPKGFDREHPDIGLIRKKQFVFSQPFLDKEVLATDFLERIDNCYKDIRPFFDLMSEILTTNLDGESLLHQ